MSRRTRDHPREYGENDDAGIGGLTALGPSPRIRGKCEVHQVPRQLVGTIPANTGKMSFQNFTVLFFLGPSPRIRGKSPIRPLIDANHGTIPANTGKMPSPVSERTLKRDHPREYGENEVMPLFNERDGGPSPRIRGELTRVRCCVTRKGTIPANTGRIA